MAKQFFSCLILLAFSNVFPVFGIKSEDMDVAELKQNIDSSGRWMDVLAGVAGIPREHLDGHHHPCPKCGGKDRFRLIDEKAGAVLCNRCFDRNNGDGIAAVQWMLGLGFPEAITRICNFLGYEEPKKIGKTSSVPASQAPKELADSFFPLEWSVDRMNLWCAMHPPISHAALLAFDSISAKHTFGNQPHFTLSLPIWGEKLKSEKPVGWAMLPMSGDFLPTFAGKGQPIKWVKVKTLKGSGSGWIGHVDRMATASVVWKVEGLKDALALASCPDLPEDHAVLTNAFGAKEQPEPWMVDLLAGKTVYVVHDCDTPGQNGATGWTNEQGKHHPGWCNYLAEKAADVRNVDLGAPIAEESGFDLKDWLNQSHSLSELMTLAEKAEQQKASDNKDSDLNIAIDDPFRLAKINLHQYRAGHKRNLVYWKESWYSWENGAYSEMTEKHLRTRIQRFIEIEFEQACKKALAAWKKNRNSDTPPEKLKVSARLVNDVYGATAALCQLSDSQEFNQWIGRPPTTDNLISVSNGILNITKLLDIRAGLINEPIESAITPHSSDWFSLAKVNYPFVPDAFCDFWESWLGQVFNADCESIAALQMWFGYLLSGKNHLHKIMLLIGPSRSGKGTISRVMERLFGSSALVTPTLSDLTDGFALESMVGATICNFNDARLSSRSDEAAITERLLSISGGDPQNIRRKHISTLTAVRLKVRFTIFTNLVPKFKDPSGVFNNRCILIFMPNSYLGKEDPRIIEKISSEMSGILNWAIRGIELLKTNGRISQPDSGKHLVQEMGSIISPVSQFVQEACDIEPSETIETKVLFSAWESYCRENDIDHPGTTQTFSRRLKAAFPHIDTKRPRDHGQSTIRTRQYVGIRLKPEEAF